MDSGLGDNQDWYWDDVPDEDWYRIEGVDEDWYRIEGVDEDFEYTVEVWTSADTPGKYQATQLKILGIYDEHGGEFVGPSSTGGSVSVTFRPDSNGMYYISVGSEGSDRTGVYYIRIFEQEMSEPPNGGNSDSQEEQGKEGKSTEPPEKEDGDTEPPDEEEDRKGKSDEPPDKEKEDTEPADEDTDSEEPPEKEDGDTEPSDEDSSDTDSEEPPAQNSPAEGRPTITGTAQVGETMTVDTSGISDEDGMGNVSFRYRWMVAGKAVTGETGSSYTPAEDDAGKKVSVGAAFTDDTGHSEELTSVSTVPVEPKQTQPGAPRNVTVSPAGTGELD